MLQSGALWWRDIELNIHQMELIGYTGSYRPVGKYKHNTLYFVDSMENLADISEPQVLLNEQQDQ